MKTNEEYKALGFVDGYTPNDYNNLFREYAVAEVTPKRLMSAMIDYHYAYLDLLEKYEELKYRMEGLEK